MSADEQAASSKQWPREITPEEAAKLRAHYLALARELALASGDPDRGDTDATDATVAAFVLPGD